MDLDIRELRSRDKRYVLLSKKQIIVAEFARRKYNNSSPGADLLLRYSDVDKFFNGKHNVDRCIEKLKFYWIIRTIPNNYRVFEYIPIDEIKEDQTNLLELMQNA